MKPVLLAAAAAAVLIASAPSLALADFVGPPVSHPLCVAIEEEVFCVPDVVVDSVLAEDYDDLS